MGDPVGRLARRCSRLADDGHRMIVEPFADDDVDDNLNPVGRIFYSASTLICTPASLAQEVGSALGAQAGEARLREVVNAAGLHPVPPRDRDPVQPGPRGPGLTLRRREKNTPHPGP